MDEMLIESKRDNPGWKLTQVETMILEFSGALLNALKVAVDEYYEPYPIDFDGSLIVDDRLNQVVRGCRPQRSRSVNLVRTKKKPRHSSRR